MSQPVNLSTLNIKDKICEIFSQKTVKRGRKNVNKYELCGDYTIELINSLNPSLVLDLGCGDNQYKPRIPNLVGIDIASDWAADIVADISDLSNWEDNSVDACICMGSVNFGTGELIGLQLTEIYRVLKVGGLCVMRGNRNDHIDNDNIFYGWSPERIDEWSAILGWKMFREPELVCRLKLDGTPNHEWKDGRFSNSTRTNKRLFWIWQK